MKHQIPASLRRPEERYAARQMADALIRADNVRRRRAAAMPRLNKKKAPLVETGPQRLHLSDLKSALARKRRLQGE